MKQLAGCGLGQCPGVFEAPDNGFYVVGRIPIGVDPEITKRMSEVEQVVWIPREVGLEFARSVLASELEKEFDRGYSQASGWTEDRF